MPKRANGEGSIRQRWNGRWEARTTLGYGPDGRQIRRSFYADTRAEAQQMMARAIRETQMGIPPVNERLTVRQFLDRWLETSVKPNVRPSTYHRSEQAVRLHLIPELGQFRLGKVAPQDVQAMLNKKQAGGLSSRSVQCIHAILRAALNDAVRWGELQRNVAKLVKTPRATHRPVDPFTPEESRAFLRAIEGDRLEALYVLAIASGLRQGEILGLRWEDIDLAESQLSVRHALQRLDGVYCLVEPKTVQSHRTIAIPEIVVGALKAHRVRQVEEKLSVGPSWTTLDLVFTTERGQPINNCVVYNKFKRILKKAGLRPQRFHDLRHCCATLLLVQGVHPRVVMEALGHSEVGVTLNTYSHVLTQLKREPAVQMDAILTGK